MSGQLQSISIEGIHGNPERFIRAEVFDNTLIIVGENGSGKTTFLRVLFHFLSGRWFALGRFRFESIKAVVDGEEFIVLRSEIARETGKLDQRILANLPIAARRRLNDFIEKGQIERLHFELDRMGLNIQFPEFFSQSELFEKGQPRGMSDELRAKICKLKEILNAQILYLPTFRRIEQELTSIFEGMDSEDLRRKQNHLKIKTEDESFVELVEFGMKDVQAAVDTVKENLKEFARESLNNLTLKYLGDIVNEEYKNVPPVDISDSSGAAVQAVLDRIDESILNQKSKEHLFAVISRAQAADHPSEHDQIICHYFLKLRAFQEALQDREKPISAFCAVCSEYIKDKEFIYDRATYQFGIFPKKPTEPGQKIELSDLSSGEKQIVSLFSHLYLSGNDRYFVLIDEPELSLSVPWQKRFLVDIRKGKFCAGLVAVTHSPFIYDNELRSSAHSLGEFTNY